MPRSCSGSPSSAKTGSSIQAKSGTNPVHQITFVTSRSRPSSSTGRPPRAPTVLGTRSIPAAVKSFGLTRASGRPRARNFRRTIRPIGVLHGQHVRDQEPDHRHEQPIPPASGAEGLLARVPSRQPGPVTSGHLQGDLSPRVGGADDEDAALPQLGRIPVFAGMQLHEARIELGGEGGKPGALVRARCHDDLVGLEPAVPSRHDVPVPLPGEPVHANAGSNREIESGRVGLQVVGDLVLGGEGPGGRGEGPARQPVVARGGEQAKRVPPLAPGVADPLVRVQDHEGHDRASPGGTPSRGRPDRRR